MNQFGDLTKDEFRHYNGGESGSCLGGERPTSMAFKDTGSDGANPSSVDWTTQGVVTPVKNQGQCGSCWSFSATGAMECNYAIKHGPLTSLSEQQLVDCSKAEGNMGCNGGLMDYAFKYAEGTAMETESQYPYKGRQGTCHAQGGALTVKDFKDVTPKSPSALQAAVAEGPVSVAIDASSILFQLYHGGIMHLFCGTSLDHGVLLVGYGTEDGKDYWMLKNSWGTTYGENGYVRLLRGKGGAGECGLLSQPSYPVVSGSGPAPPAP